jgi:DNA-binding transcriptional LysR family regulator
MSTAKIFLRFFFISFLLVGCSQNSQPARVSTPGVWRVTLDPALNWLKPVANHCMVNYPGKTLILEETNQIQPDIIHIGWGEIPNSSPRIFHLTDDTPAVIINPQNPIKQISYKSVQAVFDGTILDWKAIDSTGVSLGSIQLWNYASENPLQSIFSTWFNVYSQTAVNYKIAPDQSAMLEAVAANPAAIAWLPSRAVTTQVKVLNITDVPQENTPIPVLVYLNKNPGNSLQAWVFCMQQELH